MAGGLMNIISYGPDDLYLTGAPQITFFKMVYRRYTNFSSESISISLGNINFGDEITIPFPKVGDLVSNTYLQFELPSIHFLKTDTAADLTSDESKILTTPFAIPLTQTQLDIANSYQIINDYMVFNMAGYRAAIDNKNVINQTTREYVTVISNAFSSSSNVNYINALKNALEYENSIGNTKNNFILDYRMSDIRTILTSNIIEPGLYANYTIDKIFNMIQIATNTSIKVKDYFFKKVQEKHLLELDANSQYAKFAWVEKIGLAMIDRIDVNIGAQRIDRHYGDWLNIWHELTGHHEQEQLFNNMIGNIDELIAYNRNAKPSYLVTIPLSFWFCKKLGLAFPMIAMQNDTLSLTVKLKTFDECAYLERLPTIDQDGNEISPSLLSLSLADIWDNMSLSINGNLLVDYIYLDTLERKRFAQSAHEYLIETVETTSFSELSDINQTIKLEFNGPCKEMIWIAQKSSYVTDDYNLKKYFFNYSLNVNNKGNPIVRSTLLLNGDPRFDSKELTYMYFNYVQPSYHHTKTPSDGINVYSFSLFPEEHQPTSACNFSLIGNPQLLITLNPQSFTYNSSDVDPAVTKNSNLDEVLETTVNINIYALRYDIIRIIGGMAGFAYQYMS